MNSFARHGFRHIYVLNGHGANLEPLKNAVSNIKGVEIRIKSWWDFERVNELRGEYYGDWEGMHATPSEISITRVDHRTIRSSLSDTAPEQLSKRYIQDHSGDKHGNARDHKCSFLMDGWDHICASKTRTWCKVDGCGSNRDPERLS